MDNNDAEKPKGKDGDYPAKSSLEIEILEEYHAGKRTKRNPTNCPADS